MHATPTPRPSESRNDLFHRASCAAADPPPPLLLPTPPRTPLGVPARTPRGVFEDLEPVAGLFGVAPLGGPTTPERMDKAPSSPRMFPKTSPETSPHASSKTSSFFAAAADDTPPPAPRLRDTSPAASLSRRASGRTRAMPPSSAALHVPDDLAPLHQSPSLAPAVWTLALPHPPAAEDVVLRMSPEPRYLLGEGRYATVYLGSYRKETTAADEPWSLCAVKRLAPDRESQTMGLREAFFLNRLTACDNGPKAEGKVHVVKLIAVKEDDGTIPGHVRTASEQVDSPRRQRSSTIYAGARQDTGSHPSLPSLVSEQPALPCASRLVLVLEHAPLGTLDRLLRSSPGLVGPELWGRWARESAQALAWVHEKGVVHADVKPSNLLLTDDLHLRLSDFGSSLLIHPSHPPTDGVGLGTLPFSAPELVDPAASFGFAVDIFALGATLYQCLTGREPYRGSRPVEMMHLVRRGGLWTWLERERLARIDTEESAPASPYPSAWRTDPMPCDTGAGVRRTGSLRVPLRHSSVKRSPLRKDSAEEERKLSRVGSAESLQASADAQVEDGASPAGVRLWAAWQRGGGNDIDRLLSPTRPPTGDRHSRCGSDSWRDKEVLSGSPLPRSPTSPQTSSSLYARGQRSQLDSPPSLEPPAAYSDGAPALMYLGGGRVAEDVREVLRTMLDADEDGRPTADELVAEWGRLGVGRE